LLRDKLHENVARILKNKTKTKTEPKKKHRLVQGLYFDLPIYKSVLSFQVQQKRAELEQALGIRGT